MARHVLNPSSPAFERSWFEHLTSLSMHKRSVLNQRHRGKVARWLFSSLAVYFVEQIVRVLIWQVNTKVLLKLVTNESEWWSLKSLKWRFTLWNCHIWQLVWLLFFQQCHLNTKYQSWCFYNVACIQPSTPPLCHCLDKLLILLQTHLHWLC